MLKIVVPMWEDWDPVGAKFVYGHETTICLEHSLLSLSKWESKYHKPFLSSNNMTDEEIIYYVKCMTVTPNISDDVYLHFTNENLEAIKNYINDSMTATTFSNRGNKKPNRQVITSEIIYYDMVALGIPFECQKWHLNRLLTLIHVCEIKNSPSKKMSKKSLANKYRSLNAERRSAMNSRG